MTTGDFAVKIFISKKLWNDWLDHKKQNGLSSFKKFIKAEIEAQVTALPRSFGKSKVKEEQIKIAYISFCYDNADIIRLLKKRGGAAMAGKTK